MYVASLMQNNTYALITSVSLVYQWELSVGTHNNKAKRNSQWVKEKHNKTAEKTGVKDQPVLVSNSSVPQVDYIINIFSKSQIKQPCRRHQGGTWAWQNCIFNVLVIEKFFNIFYLL